MKGPFKKPLGGQKKGPQEKAPQSWTPFLKEGIGKNPPLENVCTQTPKGPKFEEI